MEKEREETYSRSTAVASEFTVENSSSQRPTLPEAQSSSLTPIEKHSTAESCLHRAKERWKPTHKKNTTLLHL